MNANLKDLATKALSGDEAAQVAIIREIRMGHTRSGASGCLYRKANGRGVRRFTEAVRSYAEATA